MEIELNQILFQVLNFGILVFVLTKFLFRPITDLLDQRSSRIEKGLAAAEKNLREQEKLEEKKAAELAKAEAKAASIVAMAKDESKKMGVQIIAEAKKEAEKVVAKQEADFTEKIANMEKSMQSKINELVVATTKKVLTESLSDADVKSITTKLVKKL